MVQLKLEMPLGKVLIEYNGCSIQYVSLLKSITQHKALKIDITSNEQ